MVRKDDLGKETAALAIPNRHRPSRDTIGGVPVAAERFQSGVVFRAVGAGGEASEDEEDAEDPPGGVHQVIDGQVVVDSDENPGILFVL
jgi:hypothetical protein